MAYVCDCNAKYAYIWIHYRRFAALNKCTLIKVNQILLFLLYAKTYNKLLLIKPIYLFSHFHICIELYCYTISDFTIITLKALLYYDF